MDDLKLIIAKNISELRKKQKLTQLELAEKLNYSDKAVSKWERGESVPDITVLKSISELFGVTVDYLITEEHTEFTENKKSKSKRRLQNYGFITGMSIILVWLIATMIVVVSHIVFGEIGYFWLAFVYSVPVSLIIWLVFNSVWFNRRRNFSIISLLMWTVIASLYITLLPFGIRAELIFVLCVPGQAIIFMWSRIKRSR